VISNRFDQDIQQYRNDASKKYFDTGEQNPPPEFRKQVRETKIYTKTSNETSSCLVSVWREISQYISIQ
jgi:hypothetical protein